MQKLFGMGILLLALAAGCGDDDNNRTPSATGGTGTGGGSQETIVGGNNCEGVTPNATIALTDSGLSTREVHIDRGGVVRWVNESSQTHTIVSERDEDITFDSGQLAPGDSFCVEFLTDDDVDFFCTEHSGERGEVEVDDDDDNDDDDDR